MRLLALIFIATLACGSYNRATEKKAKSYSLQAEPQYCNLQYLKNNSFQAPVNLKKHKGFLINGVMLSGLAVGESRYENTRKMAESAGLKSENKKFCTWYLNDGNHEAELHFNWMDLPNPRDLDLVKLQSEYRKNAKPLLKSMAQCVISNKYLALGCNGMKHRGPSVFGMFLAFSGCSTETSLYIVNELWGSNGVPDLNRSAVIELGHEFASENPELVIEVQQALEGK